MSQFWDHFPKLESLRFPLYFIISHLPPRGHPIKYLVGSDVHFGNYIWRAPARDVLSTNIDTLITFCRAAQQLVVVRGSYDWKFMTSWEAKRVVEATIQVEALGTAIRIEDKWGQTWKESQC